MMKSEDCEFVIPEGVTVADIVYQSRLRDQIDGAVVKPGTSQDWRVILLVWIMPMYLNGVIFAGRVLS
jgi:hypothetical protein